MRAYVDQRHREREERELRHSLEYDREYGPPGAVHHIMERELRDRHDIENKRRALYDAAARLFLTLVAGGVIGFDRDKGGHPAGLGTTILVCLAAALAMLEANLLLPTSGKTPSSFGSLDFMRLPLGILTGMGFLGAGAILRRGDHVSGLTTAATLWVTTVIGLCLGAGELTLGIGATFLCVAVGAIAKRVEAWIAEDQTADLIIEVCPGTELLERRESELGSEGYSVIALGETITREGREIRMRIRRRSRERLLRTPSLVGRLGGAENVRRIAWSPRNAPRGSGDRK